METIEQLVRQAELHHKSTELNVMFAKNMEFFKNVLPEIYERYHNYTPTEIQLTLTEDGWVDLVNLQLGNKPVYGKDPQLFAEETVASYLKNPLWQRLQPASTVMLQIEQESHTKHMNELIDYFNEKNIDKANIPIGEKTEFMFMLGVGLGYQITELLKHTEIQHLVIAETTPDIFFASLHTLDWHALSDEYDKPDKTINIILNQPPQIFFGMIEHHLNQIGIFNAAKPFIFTHLCSTELSTTTTSFLQNIPILVGSLGYFDDEKVGLTHSLNNLRNHVPFLKNHAFLFKKFEDKPVFLIGNGPSLDTSKDFIAANRDKAILISCGTALSSLFKLGIKPDFHVELERTYPIKEWIETATTPEFRKGIRLLAINTVHPGLPQLFDTAGLGLKFNDLGAAYVEQFISEDELTVTLGACNPVVSNAGLSFCAALGFIEVYIIGMDLGFPAGNKHHSSFSFHYDIKDEDIDSFNLDIPADDSDYKLDGNFGGKVITTALFLRTKLALESILADCKEMKCFNTSNGIAITGSTPKHLADIDTSSWPAIDKEQYCDQVFNKNFSNKNFIKTPNDAEIIDSFKPAISVLNDIYAIFEKDITDIQEGIQLLNQNHKIMAEFNSKSENHLSYLLLKGSSITFSFMMARCLHTNNNAQDGIDAFNFARLCYRKYIKAAQYALENELLVNDNKAYDIKGKLK